jgi:hypothetical protein
MVILLLVCLVLLLLLLLLQSPNLLQATFNQQEGANSSNASPEVRGQLDIYALLSPVSSKCNSSPGSRDSARRRPASAGHAAQCRQSGQSQDDSASPPAGKRARKKWSIAAVQTSTEKDISTLGGEELPAAGTGNATSLTAGTSRPLGQQQQQLHQLLLRQLYKPSVVMGDLHSTAAGVLLFSAAAAASACSDGLKVPATIMSRVQQQLGLTAQLADPDFEQQPCPAIPVGGLSRAASSNSSSLPKASWQVTKSHAGAAAHGKANSSVAGKVRSWFVKAKGRDTMTDDADEQQVDPTSQQLQVSNMQAG